MTRKSSKYPHAKHWIAVSNLLGLISRAYHNLHHYRSNQQPQNVEAELLPMMPNQLIIVRMRNCMIICILKVRFYLTEDTTTPKATTSQIGVKDPRNYNTGQELDYI